jgi:hypothetical protein
VDAPQVVVVRKVVYQHRRVASSTPRPSRKATAMTMHISTYKSQGLLRYAYANSTYTAAACDASAAVQVLRTTPASARSCFPRRRYVCVLPSEDRGEARRVSPWGRAGQGQSPSRSLPPPPSSVKLAPHKGATEKKFWSALYPPRPRCRFDWRRFSTVRAGSPMSGRALAVKAPCKRRRWRPPARPPARR